MGLLLAESEVFWKSPSVYDVAGLIGLLLGIGSIWLALALAKKQLRIDLKKAATEAVAALQRDMLTKELADAIRYFRDAGTFLGLREWNRALNRLEDGLAVVTRSAQSRDVQPHERAVLHVCIAKIRGITLLVMNHRQSAGHRAYLPADKLDSVGELLLELERLQGRIAYVPNNV